MKIALKFVFRCCIFYQNFATLNLKKMLNAVAAISFSIVEYVGCPLERNFRGYRHPHIRQSGAEVWGDFDVLCRVYCHVRPTIVSRYGYWISGNGTLSHSSSVVCLVIAFINCGSAQNGVFAVSRTCKRIRFGRDVN